MHEAVRGGPALLVLAFASRDRRDCLLSHFLSPRAVAGAPPVAWGGSSRGGESSDLRKSLMARPGLKDPATNRPLSHASVLTLFLILHLFYPFFYYRLPLFFLLLTFFFPLPFSVLFLTFTVSVLFFLLVSHPP
jgi:hypothetical protein